MITGRWDDLAALSRKLTGWRVEMADDGRLVAIRAADGHRATGADPDSLVRACGRARRIETEHPRALRACLARSRSRPS